MLRPIDNYFLQQPEPHKSCLEWLRDHILKLDKEITERWQYGMPFYYYRDKRVCYLWVHKKFNQPYVGIIDGKKIDYPELLQEKRARMKIFLVDPTKNIPRRRINLILNDLLSFYK